MSRCVGELSHFLKHKERYIKYFFGENKSGDFMNGFFKTVIVIFLCVCFLCLSVSAVSRVGSAGDEVSEIQRRLKYQGFYPYAVDGIFGVNTKAALIKFQKANGLAADGIAGKKTLAALGIGTDSNSSGFNSSDTELLAHIISGEARGESYLGQVAVGAVVLNRVVHPSFPDTVAGVIFESGAFTAVSDGQFYSSPTDSSYNAAAAALNGIDPTGGAIYYYNPDVSKNEWIRKRDVIATIGSHLFCA